MSNTSIYSAPCNGASEKRFLKLADSATMMSALWREKERYMMASSPSKIEQRVSALEVEVTKLKHKIDEIDTVQPWWQQIMGTFENDPIYDEAMKRGRQYRESLRPKASTRSKT